MKVEEIYDGGEGVNGKVLMVDEERCTGCLLCAIGCSIEHTGDISLRRAHITVSSNGKGGFVPLACHHCETPECVQACPTKACHQDHEARRVLIDKRKCIGCRGCVIACPFSHAHYDDVARVSSKCDYCDGAPECVRLCEPKALKYVFSDDDSGAKRRESPLARATSRISDEIRRPSPEVP